MDLRARWREASRSLGAAGDVDGAFDALVARHREPARAYHDVRHLEQCFAELDAVRAIVRDPATIALAIFFHDAIYDVRDPSENEARSAALAEQVCLGLGITDAVVRRVRQLVEATKTHAGLEGDADGEIFLDIDMSILGQPRLAFERYERDVRREYEAVPDEAFDAGRAAFLEALLARPFIFQSDAFRDRYERVARENVARSLAALRAERAR